MKNDSLTSHPLVESHGRDVYPPELLAAALANGVTSGDDDNSELAVHSIITHSGEDVYPPELLAAARANTPPPQ